MTKPLIQIDDSVREMTDEEYASYQVSIAGLPELDLDTETTQE